MTSLPRRTPGTHQPTTTISGGYQARHAAPQRTSPAVLLDRMYVSRHGAPERTNPARLSSRRPLDLPGRVGKGAPPFGDPAAPHTTAT